MEHYHHENVYMRKVTYEKGWLILGRVHKYHHTMLMLEGKMVLWTQEGKRIVKGFNVFESPPGTQRAAWILERTTVMNIHPAEAKLINEADSDDFFTYKTFDEYAQARDSGLLAKDSTPKGLPSTPSEILGEPLPSHAGKRRSLSGP